MVYAKFRIIRVNQCCVGNSPEILFGVRINLGAHCYHFNPYCRSTVELPPVVALLTSLKVQTEVQFPTVNHSTLQEPL